MKKLKFNKKALLSVVAIVLVALTGIILVGNLGIQALNPAKWEFRSVNEDNLYQAMSFADKDGTLANGENGINVTIDEDRIIQCKGTAEVDDIIVVGTYELEAGKSYVFDSGINGSKGTVYLRLTDVDNDEEIKSCYNSAVVISGDEISDNTTAKLEIVVAKDTSLNNLKIKPVLCIGTSATDLVEFYK